MISINKNLVTFLILITLLGTFAILSLQKLLPFAKHTSYYCQSLVNSFSFSISHYIGYIPFLLIFALLFVATIKLLIILSKAHYLKKKLLRKTRTNAQFTKVLKKLHLRETTHLIESNKKFAFCLGLRNPKIYISTSLVTVLSREELEAVLRHEKYHMDNRDSLTMLVASIGESLLPFFPLLSDFLRNYRIEREIKADQVAIQGLGDEKPLIGVLKKLLDTPSVATVSVTAIADHDTLEPRILMLLKNNFQYKHFRLKHIVISSISVCIMSLIMLSPVHAVAVPHQGQDVIMICPSGEACLNSCKKEYSPEKNYSEDIIT